VPFTRPVASLVAAGNGVCSISSPIPRPFRPEEIIGTDMIQILTNANMMLRGIVKVSLVYVEG